MTILRVGIIGSRSRDCDDEDKILVRDIIVRQMNKGVNLHLVSGGCKKGGDRFAEELAKEFGLPITIFPPKAQPGCSRREYAIACYERNLLIAKACDILLAVWDKVSRGTKDTIDKAESLGKTVVIL